MLRSYYGLLILNATNESAEARIAFCDTRSGIGKRHPFRSPVLCPLYVQQQNRPFREHPCFKVKEDALNLVPSSILASPWVEAGADKQGPKYTRRQAPAGPQRQRRNDGGARIKW